MVSSSHIPIQVAGYRNKGAAFLLEGVAAAVAPPGPRGVIEIFGK